VLDLEDVLRPALDRVRDGVAVGRAHHEHTENEHVERALGRLTLQRRFTAWHENLSFQMMIYA
jgi:hypothetical protein